MKVTKEKIIYFIAELLKGNIDDKEYQRQIVDNLVYKVYTDNDSVVVYLNIRGSKDIETINLNETKKAITSLLGVQPLTALVEVKGIEPLSKLLIKDMCYMLSLFFNINLLCKQTNVQVKLL